jgi:hypothetical protein
MIAARTVNTCPQCLASRRLVFIDETATSTNMVRLRGRCPRGVRLVGYVSHGHWKTITFVAGLRHNCMRWRLL